MSKGETITKSENDPDEKRRTFTIELNSGSDVKRVAIPNGAEGFLIEGTIGELEYAGFVEDSVLELTGTCGVLRVDLTSQDLVKHAKNHRKDG